MRKTIHSLLLVLCVVSTGMVFTSCGEGSSWLSSIGSALSGLFGLSDIGATTIYTGTASLSMYNYNAANNTYNQDSRLPVNLVMQVGLTVEEQAEGYDYVQVQFLGPVGVDSTTVDDFSFVTYCQEGTIDPSGGTYLTGGTCTFNHQAETDVTTACIEGQYTSSSLTLSKIYFQIGDKLFIGKFDGTVDAD